MGTVPDLYTTGDNDPEIDPVSYYRHYVYCDACGSFELDSWTVPDSLAEIETTRRRLARAALIASPLVAAWGWIAFGLFPSPSLLVFLAGGLTAAVLVRLFPGRDRGPGVAQGWRFVKKALLWLPVVVAMELAGKVLPPKLVFFAGLIVLVGLLVVRAILGARIRFLGLRCRGCSSTYAYGTPFFTDLDANPRHLTVADVPRPLGRSLFWRGRSVEDEPAKPLSQLPR